MKKLLLSFITATLLSSMSAGSAGAQELPEQKETLATIVKVNDYFMKKYADYTLVFWQSSPQQYLDSRSIL